MRKRDSKRTIVGRRIKNECKLVIDHLLHPTDTISKVNSKTIRYNHSAQIFLPSGG